MNSHPHQQERTRGNSASSLQALPIAIGMALAALPTAQASLIVSYAEDSNSYVSTLSNTSLLTFDALPATAKSTNLTWLDGTATVGTIDQVYIHAADQYGGAGASGSNYAVQSTSVGGTDATPVTTVNLTASSAYFGMWWSAGDDKNVLKFYSANTLVAQFTTNTLISVISSSPEYYGNPRTGQNASQPYAFINFFGQDGTTWDKIILTNQGSSGFESDNWTDRTGAWGTEPGETGPPPGVIVATVNGVTVTPVPEPSAISLLALLPLVALRRRRD